VALMRCEHIALHDSRKAAGESGAAFWVCSPIGARARIARTGQIRPKDVFAQVFGRRKPLNLTAR
jgi:hypothetical protein